MAECIFCEIVKGNVPAHIIWEGPKHLAFLSIFPNTEGFTVVICKEHLPSDAFNLTEEQYHALFSTAYEVAPLLKQAFTDVERVAMVAEGTGVDHAHIKLIPLHGTDSDSWREAEKNETYFETYPGYICTNDSKKADDDKLKALAEKIKNQVRSGKDAEIVLPPDDGVAEFHDPMSDDSED